MDDVRTSEYVWWVFPIHYMSVPSKYMRFIGLISEREACEVFAGTYAAVRFLKMKNWAADQDRQRNEWFTAGCLKETVLNARCCKKLLIEI